MASMRQSLMSLIGCLAISMLMPSSARAGQEAKDNDLNKIRYVAKCTYDESYEDGKRAFDREDWQGAVDYMESAVEDYFAEKRGMSACYARCRGNGTSSESSDTEGEEAVLLELASQAQCAEACKRTALGLRGPVSDSVKEKFAAAYPFHYLQYAYYQLGDVLKAATAAVTYSLINPGDQDMKDNLVVYRKETDLQSAVLTPRMDPPGRVLYEQAAQFYQQAQFALAAETMHSAIKIMINDYNICHSNCDASAGGDDIDANNFLDRVLQMQKQQVTCRLRCWISVGENFGKYHPLEVLPDGYNYIQFSLNGANDLDGAARAAVNYLHLKPHDIIMQGNLEYYRSQEVKVDQIKANPMVADAVKQVADDRQALSLLKNSLRQTEEAAFREELGIDDPNDEDVDEVFASFAVLQRRKTREANQVGDVGANTPKKAVVRSKEEVLAAAKVSPVVSDDEIFYDADEETPPSSEENFQVLESPENHSGLSRVLVDGVATQEQCDTMLELAKNAKPGSGYGGRPSPHTDKELFEGLTVGEAADGATKGDLNITSVLLYLDLAEKSRKFMEKFFKLDNLYFSYSHLVCRTSLSENMDANVDDLLLSHPIHADNCILKEDGRCVKESPAYTWRDYSAILYLNENFLGGDFFYAHRQKQTVQHRVRPSCGRLVGFGADESNLHGVMPLLSGRRCVIALWMTLQPNKDEGNHAETITKLEKLRAAKGRSQKTDGSSDKHLHQSDEL